MENLKKANFRSNNFKNNKINEGKKHNRTRFKSNRELCARQYHFLTNIHRF